LQLSVGNELPRSRADGVSHVIPNLPARLWRDSGSSLDSCLSAKGRSASGGRRNDNHDAEHRGIKPEVAL